LAGHIIERSDVSVIGAPKVDITGGTGTPENRVTITSNYTLGPVNFQLQGRWIDATRLAAIGGGGRLAVSGVDFDDATISSNAWFNGQIGYTGELANGSTWTASLNVQNLFDRNPPVIPNYGSRGGSQTINDNYDAEGRRYQLNFNYSF
jgi:outer membrane receptor protein involved in Fe transport